MNKDTDKLIDKEPENVTGGAVTDIDGSCKEKRMIPAVIKPVSVILTESIVRIIVKAFSPEDIDELTKNSYLNSAKVATEKPVLRTYSDHTEKHISQVVRKSDAAADVIESVNLDEYGKVNREELMAAALFHDCTQHCIAERFGEIFTMNGVPSSARIVLNGSGVSESQKNAIMRVIYNG